MKKRVLLTLGALSVMLVLGAFAASPGTEADPLVTKSYIDSVVYPATQFQTIELKSGHSLVGTTGTEFIVRMGTCTAIGTAKGGLADVTAGVDLPDATIISGNHLVITPFNDGRGIWAATDAIVMVKGAYTKN